MAGARPLRVVKPARKAGKTLKWQEREKYFELRSAGANRTTASSEAGITMKTAKKFEDEWLAAGNPNFDQPRAEGAYKKDLWTPAAREAAKDFNVFQERYFGRVPLPWQKTAADTIVKLSKTPTKEYVVINAPPGAGKSTLFTHDIPIWLIVRNRGIRILILSSTNDNAAKFSDRIRNTLDMQAPIKAEEIEIRQKTAKDAQTTLIKEFGIFKPEESTTWTKSKIRVARPKGEAAHKDNTVEAFGRDQDFLGGRFDIVICDDVYTPKNAKTPEQKDEIKRWFRTVAMSRLEPNGLLILAMQRVDSDDLSRFCLDMEAYDFEDDEEVDQEELKIVKAEQEKLGIEDLPVRDGKRRMFRHIIYKAHFDDECKGAAFHRKSAPAYPEGCLLYPRRLDYPELKTKEKNDPGEYKVWYQQEDHEPSAVLVLPEWIKGGLDEFGIDRPGCWDSQRYARELPPVGPGAYSFISVDPSPTQFWAVEWWIYDDQQKTLYLTDLVRQKMTSDTFFDYQPQTASYSGVLPEIVSASHAIGAPITHMIFERNGAQRFMLESSVMGDYFRANRIAVMPHTTTQHNKSNTELGVQGLQSWFREGRIRLPGGQADVLNTRTRSMKLVDEVTRYRLDGTHGYTDDTVLAAWFATLAVGNLYRPKKERPRQQRPSWAGRTAAFNPLPI